MNVYSLVSLDKELMLIHDPRYPETAVGNFEQSDLDFMREYANKHLSYAVVELASIGPVVDQPRNFDEANNATALTISILDVVPPYRPLELMGLFNYLKDGDPRVSRNCAFEKQDSVQDDRLTESVAVGSTSLTLKATSDAVSDWDLPDNVVAGVGRSVRRTRANPSRFCRVHSRCSGWSWHGNNRVRHRHSHSW